MKMVAQPWTAEQEQRLRALYPTTSVRELASIFNRSPEAVKSRATLLRIGKAKQRKLWTAADEWTLRAYYPHISNPVLSRRIDCTIFALYRRAHQLGLHKSQIYLDGPDACRLRRGNNVGWAYRYPKGHIPANNGTRRPGFSAGRMRETQFRKGQSPPNTLPLWSFRINTDGYMLLKTGKPGPKPNNGWEWVHKLVWEQAHGPIPKGHRIWWKNRDRTDNSLGNLELLSATEHMASTTIHNFPAPLRQVIQLKGALKRRIGRMEKQNAEEHDGRSPQSPVRDDRSLAG